MSFESQYSFRNKARATLMVAALALAGHGCSGNENPAKQTQETSVATVPEDDHFSGGCDKFGVYSQNRWVPYGTAVRTEPDILAPKKTDIVFAPNEVIAVDGWISTGKPVYPTNQPPWNSDVWFHLANDLHGWVSFAGVRAEPTTPDPTGLQDGGKPAPITPECKGSFKP